MQNLKNKRKVAKITQEELARVAGVSRQTIVNIERGLDYRMGTWLRLMQAFDKILAKRAEQVAAE